MLMQVNIFHMKTSFCICPKPLYKNFANRRWVLFTITITLAEKCFIPWGTKFLRGVCLFRWFYIGCAHRGIV